MFDTTNYNKNLRITKVDNKYILNIIEYGKAEITFTLSERDIKKLSELGKHIK